MYIHRVSGLSRSESVPTGATAAAASSAGCASRSGRTTSTSTSARSAAKARGTRYESFAPVRHRIDCEWYVDGRAYFSAVADALETAEKEIFISGWCVSPEVYLRRTGTEVKRTDRLDLLLQKKAEEGVQIFILLWHDAEVTVGGTVNSANARRVLTALHPNIRCLRHPGGKTKISWTHHQKFVVIDQNVAFVGGIDLCFGRYDYGDHTLIDHCHLRTEFPGKDYYQPRVQDFADLEQPFTDLVDREREPRMPWHDIHCRVSREVARDVSSNFVQRWNHHLHKKKLSADPRFADYPMLDVALEAFPDALIPQGSCEVQVVRSLSHWSAGLDSTERSIQTAYLSLIENAKHFIYIENQYFISVENAICEALFRRISRAIQNKEVFRVVVLLPITPCGSWETSSIRYVMKWQYDSISRGGKSLLERLEAAFPGVQVYEYVTFYSLRNTAWLGDRLVTDQIYIHSKLMIVDDRVALIGSANINDRSMNGNRDSEIAVIIEDTNLVESKMNGQFFLAGKFAHTLRVELYKEHLGMGDEDTAQVIDPVCTRTYVDVWSKCAVLNQRILENVFPDTPSNSLKTIAEVRAVTQQQRAMDADGQRDAVLENKEALSQVRGHLVTFPLRFLFDEKLDAGMTIEAILPNYVFQ